MYDYGRERYYAHPKARIGERVTIGHGAWIGEHVTIGDDADIQPGAVIGSDGFGYHRTGEVWTLKDHRAGVVIGCDVRIGANTCIDRGSWRDTTLADGVRVDNLVHIAHNVIVHQSAVIVAHAELSGSVTVEQCAWIGPSACVRQRLTVGARALVGMGAVVTKDIPADETWAGSPARCLDGTQGVRESM